MSTLEATVSMLEVLPEADLVRIQDFAKFLFMSHSSDYPFRPLTRDQIIGELDASEAQYASGQFMEASSFASEMADKYGL